MSIAVYHIGDSAHLTAVFEDEQGAAVDPLALTLKVKDPSGNVDTYTYSASITRDSEGHYSKDIDIDEAGDWFYEWVSTGDAVGGEPGQFVVAPSHF